jgi:hypothetical protein
MKAFLHSLIATQSGWLVRQALKFATVGGAALTTWLTAQGATPEHSTAIVTGTLTAMAGLVEFGLSKLASRIASK